MCLRFSIASGASGTGVQHMCFGGQGPGTVEKLTVELTSGTNSRK